MFIEYFRISEDKIYIRHSYTEDANKANNARELLIQNITKLELIENFEYITEVSNKDLKKDSESASYFFNCNIYDEKLVQYYKEHLLTISRLKKDQIQRAKSDSNSIFKYLNNTILITASILTYIFSYVESLNGANIFIDIDSDSFFIIASIFLLIAILKLPSYYLALLFASPLIIWGFYDYRLSTRELSSNLIIITPFLLIGIKYVYDEFVEFVRMNLNNDL